MPSSSAAEILDELIAELGAGNGPVERVVQEYNGSFTPGDDPDGKRRSLSDRTHQMMEELREAWGPTANPDWVEDVLPDSRDDDDSDTAEYDSMFALFHRSKIWAYVRVRRKPENEEHTHGRLTLKLGVVRGTQ